VPVGTDESFVRLFRGRGDAYGSWAGGCIRKPLTPEHFRRHLYSHEPRDWIGVYNVLQATRCSWGCIDIDVPAEGLARNLRAALRQEDIPAWIERTTRGFHVWVFPADRLVDAATMRQALHGACVMVEYTPREVFPKQVEVTGSALGNYVRLPLNGSRANPAPRDVRRFVHEGVTLHDMDMERAHTRDLERLAETVPLPQAVDVPVDIEMGLEVQWEVERIGGAVLNVWRDGPKYGHDRSSTLAQLAHLCREADLPVAMAYAIVRSGDERWGKFHLRGESATHYILKIVSQAYGAAASA
jgi:hypothetical protein